MITQSDSLLECRSARGLEVDQGLSANAFNKTFCLLIIGVFFDGVEIRLDDLKFQR